MKYFLAKTEPEEYSIEDLKRDKMAPWTGVKNPQAKRFLSSMKASDRVFIYHTGKVRAIVGIAKVVKAGEIPHFEYLETLKTPISLALIKSKPELADTRLVRQSRLSVMDVPPPLLSFIFAIMAA